MARPSKLSEKQWDKLRKKHLEGATLASLSKEFKVSVSAIHAKVSENSKTIKTLASKAVALDNEIKSLPISQQISVNSLIQQMQAMQMNMLNAGAAAAATSYRLHSIANIAAQKIDDSSPESPESISALKLVDGYTRVANESAKTPLGLIAANRESMKEQESANTITIIGGLPA